MSEILKDKRVIIGAVVGVLVVGGGIYFLTSGSGGGAPADPPPGVTAAPPAAGAGAAGAAAAGNPGAPGAPAGGAPVAAGAGAGAKPGAPLKTSFDDAPVAGAPAPAAPAGGAGGGALDKIPPIVRGKLAPARPDPFVSFRKFAPEKQPAFSIAVARRIAARPQPVDLHPFITDPELLKGPLPYVERRVAGILYDGSVSAILETGTPGSSGTDVRVVQPGQTVPSGIPGEPDLTVASITPTTLLLRANDGRSVSVKLGAVPAAYSEAFHQAVSGGGGGTPGGGVPGGGGPPGGFGAPANN